jgi:hypothetical protein
MNTAQQSQKHPTLCRHLRTKKMYVPEEAPDVMNQAMADSGREPHCWCNRTMTEVGRDDRPVTLHRCVPGRICFEP